MTSHHRRGEPTRDELHHALRASGCSISLDDALKSPALTLALKNTAAALSDIKPGRLTISTRIDFQRRAANDDTESDL